ncbi:MAG: enoyl-CoA hydratase/isomerase family protein [Acidimicrobiales bacterium]|nr:enoyl-CoA hydratase/isomerase family protein [Acidimicrobiales bacterium]
MLRINDDSRVRVLTLDRPEALNSFDTALYDATAGALAAAATDDSVAVVVITGEGRAFSAGTDLGDMARANEGDRSTYEAEYGFGGLLEQLIEFPKPLIAAVNGIGLGIGATILGHVDLAFMSTDARLKCPFTTLGVAPEAASSYTFPLLLGRQEAMWVLLSAEWVSAEEAQRIGLVWKVCEPDELLDVTMDHARRLAALPIPSLIETKRLVVAPHREQIYAARSREDAAFQRVLGGPANREAVAAFIEKRPPDFTNLPAS